ncbi:MAG TPA: endo-1,4-beta-xylanase [Bacteroidales bacterium]|nr:endo-1,4-beta-xylanase [Bacteroidales bacterium]
MWTFCGVTSCNKDDSTTDGNELQKKIDEYNQCDEGLKDYYTPAEYFNMGVAIPSSFVDNQGKVNLIKRHFNSVTADNDMKWSSLQPTEGIFNFTNADKIVAFAQANGMKVRGHCLCWHNQVPAWIFKDGDADASKELVLQRLTTHITTVVNHFKGKVYAWDVVNEAIDDAGSYRTSQWYTICGEEYIFEAFDKYSSLGLELQITEFDVSVYTSNSDPESTYTSEIALKQAVAYGRFFSAFRDYKNDITGITFWGLADDYTWLDNFPVAGRKNYPFLFDENYNPKQAYFTVINF